jgi:hypothetical protein
MTSPGPSTKLKAAQRQATSNIDSSAACYNLQLKRCSGSGISPDALPCSLRTGCSSSGTGAQLPEGPSTSHPIISPGLSTKAEDEPPAPLAGVHWLYLAADNSSSSSSGGDPGLMLSVAATLEKVD